MREHNPDRPCMWLAMKYSWETATPIAVFVDKADADAFLEASKAGDDEESVYGADAIVPIPFYGSGDRSLRFDRYATASMSVWRETGATTEPRVCAYLADLRDDHGVVDKAILPLGDLPVVGDDRAHWVGETTRVDAKAVSEAEAVRLVRERAEEVTQWVRDGCPRAARRTIR